MNKHQQEIIYRVPCTLPADEDSLSSKQQLLDALLSNVPTSQDSDLQQRIHNNQIFLSELPVATLAQCAQEISWLLTSAHLRYALEICGKLDIYDSALISRLVTELETQHTWIISTSHFEHFLDLYGVEQMRKIFLDEHHHAEKKYIIEQCTYMGFPCANYFHLKSIFIEDEGVLPSLPPSITYQTSTEKATHFLWSYASEISYLKETLGIPIENLLTLDKAILWEYCGTLRSLTNRAWELTNTPHRDFDMSKAPVAIDPANVLCISTIMPLLQAHTDTLQQIIYTEVHDKIIRLIAFIQQHASASLPPLLLESIDQISIQIYAQTEQQLQASYPSAKKQYNDRKKLSLNPEKYALARKRKSERHGKNFEIITSLAKTLDGNNLLTESLIPRDATQSTLWLIRAYHQSISKLAHKYAGLFSVGGKIHFPSAIPQEKIAAFKSNYKLNATQFKLIHANTSLLLPPSNFPEELLFMISCMEQAGLIDNDPQLQISIPWRLPNHLWALLGSSMILLSEQHVSYTPASFGTTHASDTGRRMVVYDAGVYDSSFVRNSKHITWRTDVLLLKDVNLIPKAQVIWSLLSQTEYDGRFAQLGVSFIQEYAELLDKHNLLRAVQWPWIYDANSRNAEDPDALRHFAQVNALTEQQKDDFLIANYTKQTKWLLVFELRDLLTKYRKKIQDIQQHFTK